MTIIKAIYYDEKIVEELKKIKAPIINKNGIPVIFRKERKTDGIFQHIALKRHHLKIRDIKEIPKILKKPISTQKLKKTKTRKAYYGKRPGNNKMLLVIIVEKHSGHEQIVTFYPTKKFL